MSRFIFGLVIGMVLVMGMDVAMAQETEYTRCVNSKGQVVIVTNWTCPAGYWPS